MYFKKFIPLLLLLFIYLKSSSQNYNSLIENYSFELGADGHTPADGASDCNYSNDGSLFDRNILNWKTADAGTGTVCPNWIDKSVCNANCSGSNNASSNRYIYLFDHLLRCEDEVILGINTGIFKLTARKGAVDRKSTRLNSSHSDRSRMPSSA